MTPNLLTELARGAVVRNWLVLGPFVVRTSGHFEREYMYERQRILDIDYLEADGGEARVDPVAGKTHANPGLGPKRLAWKKYPEAWLGGMDIAGEIIYETVQRNCAIYGAATIDADSDGPALLDAYHSGMKAWVNGELVCNMPYGLPKGVRLTMPSCLIRLKKGRNLLLVKFRPGYICDGIDFCVVNVRVSPLAARPGVPAAIGRVRALPYFRGTPEAPAQVIEAAVVNTSRVANTFRVSVRSETLGAEDACDVLCEPGKVVPIRLALPALVRNDSAPTLPRETIRAEYRARVYGEEVAAPFEYEAAAPPKYDGTVYVLSSFHFDTTYHEEQRVYAMGAFDIVRQYCRLHRIDPNFRSIVSEVDYLKPYFDVYPEDRETLLRIFAEGRSEPDVMYNQPNEQNCGDEALVRNFLYGQLIHGRLFGRICHVYGPGDVFGHPNQLSQIARKSGCIGVTWGKHIFNFPPFFEHLSLDGSTLPHKRGRAGEDEVHAMGLSVRTGDIDQSPPTDWHHSLMPVHRQGTFCDLMTEIRRECAETGAHLPLTSRDMSLYHAATAVSRVDLKVANRLGENLLADAEKFATFAALLGGKYPEKALDKGWRQLLCGQHHDSITGTHNEISYVDLMNAYRETLEIGTDVLDRSLACIGRAIRAESPGFAVYNPLPWNRTDVVQFRVNRVPGESFALKDPKGKSVPFEIAAIERDGKGKLASATMEFVAKDVPAMGYRTYRVEAGGKTPPVRKTHDGAAIENEFFRIEADPARGGGWTSLYDKQAKREVLESRNGRVGNELAILEEVPCRNETQHEFYTTGLKLFSSEFPAKVEVEKGPVSATLRVRFAMLEHCEVVQEVTLYKGVPRVDCRTILLDVQREDYLYCVTFPTKLKGLAPVFDERFGVVTRNDSRHFLDFRTHQMVMFGDCAVYAANKWMEYGSSALVKTGKNKYALGMVGLVMPHDDAHVRTGEAIQRALVKKGVTCTPWYADGGPHWGTYLADMDDDLLYTRFRISIGSGGNNAYSNRLLDAQPKSVRKAFREHVGKTGCALLLVKDAALKDPSWPALPVLIVEAVSNAALDAALDDLIGDFEETETIGLSAEADASDEKHAADNYGLALLNRGTYANSVEKGGVLCMILGHTCRWYGGTNSFPEGYLVPENKHHVYAYALYPHKGTWRDANTPRAGYEYNHPLIAHAVESGPEAALPPETSFLRVEPENVLLTALKPFGNPMAAFEKTRAADPAQGILLRLYDSFGWDTTARVTLGAGIRDAWAANLVEDRLDDLPVVKGTLELDVPAFSIESVGVVPGPIAPRLPAEPLGPSAEPVQPVWVRSWEHDAESMPMGYGSVVCSIGRQVVEEDEGCLLRIKVNAVNDYTDADASGECRLIVPEGWTAQPAAIPFKLAPRGMATTEVHVRRPDTTASGQIKLRFDDDGQTFQDVLEVGATFDLEMDVDNQGDAVLVTLRNPTAESIEAEVSLVTPLETWSGTLVGALAWTSVGPRTQGVSLPAGQTIELRFDIARIDGPWRDAPDAYWAVAKLMSNGRIQLKRADRRPPERRMWSEKWFRQYRERAGHDRVQIDD